MRMLIETDTMTHEDLKELAKKMGFHLIAIKSKKFVPCKCGCNRREHWYSNNGVKLVCKGCGTVVEAKTDAKAIWKWNKTMEQKVMVENV